MTDRKSKTFLAVFSLLILVSITLTYYRYVVQQDFEYFTDEQAFNDALLEE